MIGTARLVRLAAPITPYAFRSAGSVVVDLVFGKE